MPTVEDYFDDDTDIPLPSTSSRHLPNTGISGALLEEISTEDPDVPELDYDLLAEQGRGIYGEGTKAPPPAPKTSNYKGKDVVRNDDDDTIRPSAPSAPAANTPMGGFMGDMMRMQQAEEERMEKMRQQFGGATMAPNLDYKGWNSVYPIYFDAKVSVNDGRRVKRSDAMWWPQARQISIACRSLGLMSVIEPDKTHPADWENPGRVKVQFEQNGRYINPIVKNRTQLYRQLAKMMQNNDPSLAYKPIPKSIRKATPAPAVAPTTTSSKSSKKSAKAQSQASGSNTNKSGKSQTKAKTAVRRHPYGPPRPPRPSTVPPLDDRLPLHSPIVQTGVAVASVKREIETEKENKRKGISSGMGNEDKAEGAKEKLPKIKRMVVRGKR